VGSKAWYAWLSNNKSFVYEGNIGHFTARREIRRGKSYWYGYRRSDGKLTKLYLGKSEEITLDLLEKNSIQLARPASLQSLFIDRNSVDLISTPNQQPPIITAPTRILKEIPLPSILKISPPPMPQKMVLRPQLTQRINKPVTIIYAPSGFGTSTLINEWKINCSMPVAWISLDEDDNKPRHFWVSVITALQNVVPGLGLELVPQLRTPASSALSTIVVNLANDFIKATNGLQPSEWIGLVIDNYHQIINTEIHTSLQTWHSDI
jgi:LuxR family maltose regulon positive regulatory protein